MPTPSEILASLERIANEASAVAIAWHIVVALAILAIAGGVRPSQRSAALLLTLPLISVSLVAWVFGNPFNGAVLAVAALALAAIARFLSAEPVRSDRRWSFLLGLALVVFAWVYPHFLVQRSELAYLYAAPMGVLPCPTLALVSGAALCGGIAGRAWRLTLAAVAAFYALFGMLHLGVIIDAFLLLGAIGLVIQHRQGHQRVLAADG